MNVSVRTPNRLHFGLIDLNGKLNRVDGGVGVALTTPNISLSVETINTNEVSIQPDNPLVRDLIYLFYDKFVYDKPPSGLQVTLHSTIPSHVGLGSKTQLSLAIATALSKIEKINVPIHKLAHGMGRGGTSGIGIAAFEAGGFILDGGHRFGDNEEKTAFLPSRSSNAFPPPILFQQTLPSEWRFVLALPSIDKGAHGSHEVNIFQQYCPIPEDEVREVCRIILMQLLPGVIERDCSTVGIALNQLQTIGFKKIEIDLQSPIIKELIKLALGEGATGSGMSSFGPIVYALTDTEAKANQLSQTWDKYFRSESNTQGKVWISTVQNSGAVIE